MRLPMMPETGNSGFDTKKILSIRLSPDGLSFWETTGGAGISSPKKRKSEKTEFPVRGSLYFSVESTAKKNISAAISAMTEAAGNSFEVATVYLDTTKTVLIPKTLLREELIQKYLKFNNIEPAEDETVEVVDFMPNNKAVLVFDSALKDVIEALPGSPVLATPFSLAANSSAVSGSAGKRSLFSIYLSGENAYITIFSNIALMYAEVLPYSSPTDILFYINKLGGQFRLKKSILLLSGTGTEEQVVALKRYFKKITCV